MRLAVRHHTRLTYERPIAETHMELRLRPRPGAGQVVESYRLRVEPDSEIRDYTDAFANRVDYFNHLAPHDHVDVTSDSVVVTAAGVADPDGTDFPSDYLQFRGPVQEVAGVRRLARGVKGDSVEARLDNLAVQINAKFEYRPQTTHVYTAVEEVIKAGTGVCQDFAHLFVAVARSLGLPARYVSGYIHGGAGHQGAGASHAWAEALVPGLGWVGYDPTNPIRTSEHHVRVAVGRDYQDVAPTRGTYLGAAEEVMTVEVTTRVAD
ncbi:MAG TPA: transglutaminase family protein [Candidatus Dormibacteraeota bacterium]